MYTNIIQVYFTLQPPPLSRRFFFLFFLSLSVKTTEHTFVSFSSRPPPLFYLYISIRVATTTGITTDILHTHTHTRAHHDTHTIIQKHVYALREEQLWLAFEQGLKKCRRVCASICPQCIRIYYTMVCTHLVSIIMLYVYYYVLGLYMNTNNTRVTIRTRCARLRYNRVRYQKPIRPQHTKDII